VLHGQRLAVLNTSSSVGAKPCDPTRTRAKRRTASESRAYLAELAIEEGDAIDDEKAARDATNEFHDEQQQDDEWTAAAARDRIGPSA
jgi:hypothetical protein